MLQHTSQRIPRGRIIDMQSPMFSHPFPSDALLITALESPCRDALSLDFFSRREEADLLELKDGDHCKYE